MTLQIWLHLLKEALTKNSIFCAVLYFIKNIISRFEERVSHLL